MTKKTTIISFGNYIKGEAIEFSTIEIRQLSDYLISKKGTPITTIGSRRSYGDACVGGHILDCNLWKSIIHFDAEMGIIEAESGITLQEILQITLLKLWFFQVTPGTRHITLGGAIAADVHGKNHCGKGNFSEHLLHFDIMDGGGNILRCSKEQNAALFWLTTGGMGNTGIILSAAFQLRKIESTQMDTFIVKSPNFESLFHSLSEFSGWEYASAWIDFCAKGALCGRGITYFANHAAPIEAKTQAQSYAPPPSYRFPKFVTLLSPILRPSSISFYNRLRYFATSSGLSTNSLFDSLYPLDKIYNWNILYGKNGFLQYHCCIPEVDAFTTMLEMKGNMEGMQWFPYLAVLKKHRNPTPENINSFALNGYSLALDFPSHPNTLKLFATFDRLLLAHGGRIYLAKDACSDPQLSPLHPDTLKMGTFGSWQKERLLESTDDPTTVSPAHRQP